MTTNTIEWLFERAISFESKACDFYATLAELFGHTPKVRHFWEEMSNDESRHVDMLREIRNTMPRSRLSEHVGEKERSSALKVAALLKGDLVARVTTLGDACELAHEIENSEVNAIFRILAVDSVADRSRREFLSAQIDEHLERLMGFSQEFKADYRSVVGSQIGGSEPD
jgi:rubrerythrin